MLSPPHPNPIRIAAISASLALHVAALLVLTVPWETQVSSPSITEEAPISVPWVVEIARAPKATPPASLQSDPAPQPIARTVPSAKLPANEPTRANPPVDPQPPSLEGVDPSTLYHALGMEQPMESIRAGQESQVWVVIRINTRGEPTDVTIEAGGHPVDKPLEEAARAFILKSWRFEASAQPTVLRMPLVYF